MRRCRRIGTGPPKSAQRSGSNARVSLGLVVYIFQHAPQRRPRELIAPQPQPLRLWLQLRSSTLVFDVEKPRCVSPSPHLSSGPLPRLPLRRRRQSQGGLPSNARTEITRRSLLTLARRWGGRERLTDVSPIGPTKSCCMDRKLTYPTIATLYVSEPSCNKPKIGVVYLTDAFGIQFVNNKL